MAKALQTEQTATTPPGLDAKDLQILHLLQQNARITVKETPIKYTQYHAGSRTHPQAGSQRVIKQYVALLDHTKLNRIDRYLLRVAEGAQQGGGHLFVKAIQQMPGDGMLYDQRRIRFTLKVMTADMNAYHDFHEQTKQHRKHGACAEHLCDGDDQADASIIIMDYLPIRIFRSGANMNRPRLSFTIMSKK